VGCEDGIYRINPNWMLDQVTVGKTQAFAVWKGTMWAAGTMGGLWWRTPSGWAKYDNLANWVEVWDLQVIGDRLYVVGEYDDGGGSEARVSAFSVDIGGDFVCGPNPPDVLARIVDYVQMSEV
jgi:hypothetical protein